MKKDTQFKDFTLASEFTQEQSETVSLLQVKDHCFRFNSLGKKNSNSDRGFIGRKLF